MISEGSTVAVFGCGCVGLSCINAANLVGASRVIAVDVNSAKEEWARKFGATDFINPGQLPDGKRIQDHLVELTDGGLDFTFDATGTVSHMSHWPTDWERRPNAFIIDNSVLSCRLTSCALRSRHVIKDGASQPSLASLRQGRRFPRGRESNLSFRVHRIVDDHSFQLVTGRVWRGTAFGGVKGRTELPGIVEGQSLLSSPCDGLTLFFSATDYLKGNVKVDEYVTHGYKLSEINDGFDAMHVSGSFCVWFLTHSSF